MTSKNFPKSAVKALVRYATFRVVAPFALEYLITLFLTWVVSQTLVSGMNAPQAAVGVWAIGLMLRMFVRPVAARQSQPQLSLSNTFNAADVAAFAADLEKELEKRQSTRAPSPYL